MQGYKRTAAIVRYKDFSMYQAIKTIYPDYLSRPCTENDSIEKKSLYFFRSKKVQAHARSYYILSNYTEEDCETATEARIGIDATS